jgi:hypothetical protein
LKDDGDFGILKKMAVSLMRERERERERESKNYANIDKKGWIRRGFDFSSRKSKPCFYTLRKPPKTAGLLPRM